jgi:hypothetical protein
MEIIQKLRYYFFWGGGGGNNKVENYDDMAAGVVQSYTAMGCNIYLRVHLLDSHLEFFPESLGAVSDEHRQRCHQDISTTQKRYKGKCSHSMIIAGHLEDTFQGKI